MQRSLAALIALILLFSTVGWSADFKKGFEAYLKKDYQTALREWRLAAEQGYAEAQLWLGVMHEKGQGVIQDYQTAVKWYRLAAEQGKASAQFNLGLMYSLGQSVPQDYVYAHMWINVAGSQGNKGAAKARELAAKSMTPSQIERAQDLARECVKKNFKGCD